MNQSKNEKPLRKKPEANAIAKPIEKVYDVPAEGSLGLLALGYRGLIAWREARKRKT